MAMEAGIAILKAEVEQRVAFAESMTMGKTIFEWSPRSAATREIERLTEEIVTYVQEDLHSSTETKASHR
jgi:chromosome partitioning protein